MGLALCVSSSAAGATSTISPMVALSAFGTVQSSGAVCATAGSAAAAQAAPGTGCVLPVVDQPVPVAEPAPPAYIPPPVEGGGGLGLLPLLGGLALIVGLAALILSGDSDGDITLPPFSPD